MTTSIILNENDFKNAERLTKTLKQIIENKIDAEKKIKSCFVPFVDLTKINNNRKKEDNLVVKLNSERIKKALDTEEEMELIKTCFQYNFKGNKEIVANLLLTFQRVKELSPYANNYEITSIDDFIIILNKFYKRVDNRVEDISGVSRNLMLYYIKTFEEILRSGRIALEHSMESSEFIKVSFNKILKQILKKDYIKIKGEDKFYNLIEENYYTADISDTDDEQKEVSEEEKRYDVAAKVKEAYENYNKTIEDIKNPINIIANSLYNYIVKTSIEDMDYNEFPTFDNIFFTQIMNMVRNKLNNELIDELAEKIAILDGWYIAYFKNLSSKINYSQENSYLLELETKKSF